jgi:nucleoside-diphosphate kinase
MREQKKEKDQKVKMTQPERQKPIGIQLERSPIPFHLARRINAKDATESAENILISELERKKYEKILELLSHPELDKAVREGNFTLGIIKPRAYQGKGLPEDDEIAAQMLLREVVSRGFNVVFSVNLQLTQDQAEKFYAEHHDKPFFGELVDFTASGPMTFLLIQDRSGKAVSKWRHEIGSTQASPDEKVLSIDAQFQHSPIDKKTKDPHPPGHPSNFTLRAQFRDPKSVSNNIFHGSDSRESAAREIAVLRSYIQEAYERLDGNKPGFPTEKEIEKTGILKPDVDELISIEKPDDNSPHKLRFRNRVGEHVVFYPGKTS